MGGESGGHRNESIHNVKNNKDNETENVHETDDEGRRVATPDALAADERRNPK
jgi:hypothetical protein